MKRFGEKEGTQVVCGIAAGRGKRCIGRGGKHRSEEGGFQGASLEEKSAGELPQRTRSIAEHGRLSGREVPGGGTHRVLSGTGFKAFYASGPDFLGFHTPLNSS